MIVTNLCRAKCAGAGILIRTQATGLQISFIGWPSTVLYINGQDIFTTEEPLVTPPTKTRGCVFDSMGEKPWQGGSVESPQFSLRSAGVIGCDFQFYDSVTLENPGPWYRVEGAYIWRFGGRATNCVVIMNNILPELDDHFIDDSQPEPGNCVIYRGNFIYQS